MPNVNKVLLLGNLTREVSLKHTQSGKPIAELTIAVNRKSGDREEVCYVDVTVWGKSAENCQKYLGKGSSVYVEGFLRLDKWETQSGEPRSKLRVIAETVQFISTRNGDRDRRPEPRQGVSPEYGPKQPPMPEVPSAENPAGVDDDIPF